MAGLVWNIDRLEFTKVCSRCKTEKTERAFQFIGDRICMECRGVERKTIRKIIPLRGEKERQCVGKCGLIKPVSEFRDDRNECKACAYERRDRKKEAKAKKKRMEEDPVYYAKERERENSKRRGNTEYLEKKYAARYLSKYGLTREMEAKLLENQNHRCPCCNRKFSDEVTMHRDHDHNLNHFRGFLCNNCNVALGMVEGTGNPERALIKLLEIVRDNALFYVAHPSVQNPVNVAQNGSKAHF